LGVKISFLSQERDKDGAPAPHEMTNQENKVAIVAAIEREVRPLVKQWRVDEREHEGRRFRFYEKNDLTLVCGGMGPEAARMAAEAVIALYRPAEIYSVGFAGALDSTLCVGDVFRPQRVLNAGDGSSAEAGGADGVLVSFASVASPKQKQNLQEAYGARAVDMEAAAVARAAELHGIRFAAVKAISDEWDFEFPEIRRFVDGQGRFSEFRFALYAACRPWIWSKVIRMGRDASRASRALCEWLGKNVVR
jgi:adenosylhomocysteine nucleosidase